MTNEGELVNRILRARYGHEKEYLVTVDKPIDSEFVRKMSAGVKILDTVTRPCEVEKTGKTSFRIILTQGSTARSAGCARRWGTRCRR